jgi:hypothetical protein
LHTFVKERNGCREGEPSSTARAELQ